MLKIISLLLFTPFLFAANRIELEPGATMQVLANTQTDVMCRRGNGNASQATLFKGTTLYEGANCKTLKPYAHKASVTASVDVHTVSPLVCKDGEAVTTYVLAEGVESKNEAGGFELVRVMVNRDDLVFTTN